MPESLIDELSENPFGYEGVADIANICRMGAGADTLDPHEGCVECRNTGDGGH
jgi:hypothetical protein